MYVSEWCRSLLGWYVDVCAKGGQISAATLAQYWLKREVEIENVSAAEFAYIRFEKIWATVLWCGNNLLSQGFAYQMLLRALHIIEHGENTQE